MSIFGALLAGAIDIVALPVTAVADVATLGGALTDQPEPYTVARLRLLGQDAARIEDAVRDR